MRILFSVLLSICAVSASAQSYFGTFGDGPDGRFQDADPWQEFVLQEDFSFMDPNGLEWRTPAGTAVNGASIPPMFWSLIGGPFTGKYMKASVIHDHFVVTRERTAHDTHRNFYYGMRANGVPAWKAKTMYWAVRTFGADWDLSYPNAAENADQVATNAASETKAAQITAAIARQNVLEVARNLKTSEGEVLRVVYGGPIEATLDALDQDSLSTQRNLAFTVPFILAGLQAEAAGLDVEDLLEMREDTQITLDSLPIWPDGEIPTSGGTVAQEFRDIYPNDALRNFDFGFEVPG